MLVVLNPDSATADPYNSPDLHGSGHESTFGDTHYLQTQPKTYYPPQVSPQLNLAFFEASFCCVLMRCAHGSGPEVACDLVAILDMSLVASLLSQTHSGNDLNPDTS